MPITPSLLLRPVSDDQFAIIDEAVMRCAYAVQNKFGRLFDEQVYENDLAARLRAEGFEVYTQVPIEVTHHGFKKTYFLDLVVNHMLYELKVVATLTGDHDVTSLSRDQTTFRRHLDVLLMHTKLKGIQWINLSHSQVEITTVEMGVLAKE